MRAFWESVQDAAVGERLERALHGRGVFRRFKDAVYEAGIERDWYAFKAERARRRVQAFLEQMGIEAELT